MLTTRSLSFVCLVVCLTSLLVLVLMPTTVEASLLPWLTRYTQVTTYDSVDCSGDYVLKLTSMHPIHKCFRQSGVDTIVVTVIDLANQIEYASTGTITRPLGLGLDCSNPDGVIIRAFHAGSLPGNCITDELIHNVTLPPGSDGSNFCVSTVDSSVILKCPPVTSSPSTSPTNLPSKSPTKLPSKSPTTSLPSKSPTNLPRKSPTKLPSKSPTTSLPSKSPTNLPSKSPTNLPSKSPTHLPSRSPSRSPSSAPSGSPSAIPTSSPTLSPSTSAPTTSPIVDICVPQLKMTKNTCQKLVKKCNGWNIRMKWTGPGCKNKQGKKLGDGGCQCKGYCGYQCAKACKKDKQCKWVKTICKTRTGIIGQPMSRCADPV